MSTLKLKLLLKKKNPYLFKAKNILKAQDFVEEIAIAFVSSAEETMFGNWLEGLAVFVSEKLYGAYKSSAKGIDIEFNKEGIHYIVSIKSGPNWGNSSQVKKMIEDFNSAKRTLHTSNSKINIRAVNGCCYGKDNTPYKKGDYIKLCGQEFWKFLTEIDTFYLDIIEPIGVDAKQRNDAYKKEYAKMVNKLTKEFIEEFCDKEGNIDWNKIVTYNSSIDKIQIE